MGRSYERPISFPPDFAAIDTVDLSQPAGLHSVRGIARERSKLLPFIDL